MSNSFIRELEKIEVPAELHLRAMLGVEKAISEQQNKKYMKFKKPLAAASIASVVAIGVLSSPSVQATIQQLFSVNHIQEGEAFTYIGWTWKGSGDASTSFQSIGEVEEEFQMNIPFPEKLLAAEKDSLLKEYTVNTEKGEFVSFMYSLRTEDRLYMVSATNLPKVTPEFTANTTKETVIEKKVNINGVSGTLLGIYELKDSYSLYFQTDEWKIVIDGTNHDGPKLTEEEMIKIAESIK
ncbi:hypothetical protein JOC85_003714 [Bacillus mesophilus]|uniref:DUF4367 domain-containing protein n=1 Tax=Bacillus mesophilus TaxID=1808955 RepID=A0A6M0QB05_9BACI|nr:DUF4367 domain-containing protein [Bacillus mesophilus]MBM7662903.1 hypothetical protein [Bacillus mesophilus]NEY73492.1 DUF4367 domain-containing protein [Bacillus mesophilus]